MTEKNFNIELALDSAVRPAVKVSHWNTPRSGLQVSLGELGILEDEYGTPRSAKGVIVHLDGGVDAADAAQLEEFFRKLKEALPPL